MILGVKLQLFLFTSKYFLNNFLRRVYFLHFLGNYPLNPPVFPLSFSFPILSFALIIPFAPINSYAQKKRARIIFACPLSFHSLLLLPNVHIWCMVFVCVKESLVGVEFSIVHLRSFSVGFFTESVFHQGCTIYFHPPYFRSYIYSLFHCRFILINSRFLFYNHFLAVLDVNAFIEIRSLTVAAHNASVDAVDGVCCRFLFICHVLDG